MRERERAERFSLILQTYLKIFLAHNRLIFGAKDGIHRYEQLDGLLRFLWALTERDTVCSCAPHGLHHASEWFSSLERERERERERVLVYAREPEKGEREKRQSWGNKVAREDTKRRIGGRFERV